MDRFKSIHSGETALLVGNGNNLHLTPPTGFDYPSFGMNTIHRYEGWKPTYYVAVDQRIWRDFGSEIDVKYNDVPKFVPRPHLDMWQGDNFHRFYHKPNELWDERVVWDVDNLQDGFAYHSVMHAAMQLAAFMGFTTLLMIGVEHKPGHGREHFWGEDLKMPGILPTHDWFRGYAYLVKRMREHGITVLNLSENTYVDEATLPRGDWRNYAN
jgi:hypothetical protein